MSNQRFIPAESGKIGVFCAVAAFALFSTVGLNSCLPFRTRNSNRGLRHLTSFHKYFVPPQAKNAPFDERVKPDKIRYAAFGSSVTWGSALGNRLDAYPYILSPNATNHAIRASGPNYPANCLQSMVGDEEYDVIILEFFLRATDGLETLARRLRERFPDAIVIILQNWYPGMVASRSGGLMNWAKERGYIGPGHLHDPQLQEEFLKSDDEWFWVNINDLHLTKLIEDIARKENFFISYMPRPENPRNWVDYIDYLAPDAHHLSELGHLNAALRIREIVDRVGVSPNPRIGNFSHADSCINWFESGDVSSVQYNENFRLEKMPNTEKYALTFPEGKHGCLHAINPSDTPQAVYLNYMSTGPPSNYPKTSVILIYEGKKLSSEITIDPTMSTGFGHDVHVQSMMDIGTIPKGRTSICLRTLEKTKWPFRVVSLIQVARKEGNDALSVTQKNFQIGSID